MGLHRSIFRNEVKGIETITISYRADKQARILQLVGSISAVGNSFNELNTERERLIAAGYRVVSNNIAKNLTFTVEKAI